VENKKIPIFALLDDHSSCVKIKRKRDRKCILSLYFLQMLSVGCLQSSFLSGKIFRLVVSNVPSMCV
jgi:hypothetical protein